MEINKIAAAVASEQSIPGTAQSSGAQNSQIDELRRLADSIRKMENDVRLTARVQGMSGMHLQAKLNQYDELLGKVDQQIRDLQRQNRQPTKSDDKTIGVSSLQYSTDATQLTLRNTGTSTGAAVAAQRAGALAKAEANAAERKASEAAKQTAQSEKTKTSGNASLDVLI